MGATTKVTGPEISFEPLKAEHVAKVLEIERASFLDPWSEHHFMREILTPSSYFVVMTASTELVGYGGYWLVGGEAHITNVAIDPKHRRQGLGKKLVTHLLRSAAAAGTKSASLEVRVSNVPAQRLYASLGFVEVAIHPGYYLESGEDAIVMWKRSLAQPQREERADD